MVIQYLSQVPYPLGEVILTVLGLLTFYFGYKLNGIILGMRLRSQIDKSEESKLQEQKSLNKLYESEKKDLTLKIEALEKELKDKEEKMEDYRKKISGLGGFSLGNSKRAEILYSLLLENEALEQMLFKANSNVKDIHDSHLQEKLIDIKKRQRLMSEIFNDSKIKDYVKQVVEENSSSIESPVEKLSIEQKSDKND